MIIKVCGMREPDNIRAVEALRPDWMGFIFWPGSRRCVTTPPAYLPQPPLKRVGVFVQPSLEEVVQRVLQATADVDADKDLMTHEEFEALVVSW